MAAVKFLSQGGHRLFRKLLLPGAKIYEVGGVGCNRRPSTLPVSETKEVDFFVIQWRSLPLALVSGKDLETLCPDSFHS